MAITKLDKEEQLTLSKKITKLTELNQKAISVNAASYSYDWQQLDNYLSKAILEYQHILNTAECTS